MFGSTSRGAKTDYGGEELILMCLVAFK